MFNALDIDSEIPIHPVVTDVFSTNQIKRIFNSITYDKVIQIS